MKVSTILLTAAIGLALGGCSASCLKNAKVGGEITPVNEREVKLGSIKPEVSFEFKECCPSPQDEANLDKIKGMSADWLEKYLKDEVTKDEYNEKAREIVSVMSQIQNQCSVKRTDTPAAPAGDAWKQLDSFVKATGG